METSWTSYRRSMPMTTSKSRRTPINDDYPTCARTTATLLIYPGEITPLEVSRRLDLIPTSVRTAGAEIENSLGRNRTQPINAWFLSSESSVSSKDLRRHLDWLLDMLEPKGLSLLELQKEPVVCMTVNCVWWSAGGGGGPTLWPEQMLRLAKLNLECTFAVSLLDEDTDSNMQSPTMAS